MRLPLGLCGHSGGLVTQWGGSPSSQLELVFTVVFGWIRAVITEKFSVLLERQSAFLVLWLHIEGFCCGFSCPHSLAFRVASFFSSMCGTDEVRRNPRELTATSLLRSPVLQPASLLLSFRVFLCCLYVRPSVSVELRRRNRERHVFFIFPEAEVSQQHFKNGANVGETGLVLGSINDIYSNQQNSMLLP